MKQFLMMLSLVLTMGLTTAYGQEAKTKLTLKASKLLIKPDSKVSFAVEGGNPSTTYK